MHKRFDILTETEARTLEPGAEAARAITQLEAKYAQYRLEPPPGPVLRIDVERWTGWAASETQRS